MPALLACVLPVQHLCATQAIDTLATFKGDNGSYPGYILQDRHGDFYGTTYTGGKYGKGTIFELPLNQPLKTVVSFDGADGANPLSGLLEGPDGNFYGTTHAGGAYSKGTVYCLTSDGSLRTLVSFDGANGAYPKSALKQGKDGYFYGTTYSGGAADKGVLYRVSPQGRLATMVTFYGPNGMNPGALSTGSDGSFYGTTYRGGAKGLGTAYRYDPGQGTTLVSYDPKAMVDPKEMAGPKEMVGPNGLGPMGHERPQFMTLVSFDGANGANPQSEMSELSDGNFYGTTYGGGQYQLGTVFSLSPDGAFTTVFSFDGTDGANPNSGLVQWSDGYFYMESLWNNASFKSSDVQWSGVNFVGTTSGGGENGNGTVFRITADGTLTTLVSFTGTSGNQLGTIPNSLIPGNDGNLYGTTYYGGSDNLGTVFRVDLQLTPPTSAGETLTTFNVPQPPNSP